MGIEKNVGPRDPAQRQLSSAFTREQFIRQKLKPVADVLHLQAAAAWLR